MVTAKRSFFQFSYHELPHGGDVSTQVDRLRHPLHGRNRQRNFRNETLRQLQVEFKTIPFSAPSGRLSNRTALIRPMQENNCITLPQMPN
jgi:hypothetical protein